MPLPSPLTDADHTRGASAEDAVVTLVQYGDFECPFGKQVHLVVREVMGNHPGQVRFGYRHFPIRYHAHALGAAIAAEAVARADGEDAFWAYHDRLFDRQVSLNPYALAEHARELGLDADAVEAALAAEAGRDAILAQKRGAIKAGVRSTLGLWIGGAWYEEDDFEAALVERVIKPLHAAR